MGTTALLLCRRCGVLQPLPMQGSDEEALQELAEFRMLHDPHGVVGVERQPEPALCDGPTADPMSTRWFRVAAGSDVLLVRSWRTSIDEPCRFELAAGMPATTDWVDVDEALLHRALDRHFYPHVIRATTVDRVIAAVRTLVRCLDPNEVEIAFDDTSLPNTGLAPLPAHLARELLGRCGTFFDTWEQERFASFVANHQQADGALAVRVRRALDRSAA